MTYHSGTGSDPAGTTEPPAGASGVPPARPRPPLLRRLLAAAMTLLLLVLAAEVNQLPEKLSRNHDVTRIAVGQPGHLGTAEITVTEVKLAKQVMDGAYARTASRSSGTWVVLTVVVRQRGPKVMRAEAHASGGGRTFNATERLSADPSFETQTVTAFEVPDENLPGLKATINESSLILGFDEQLEVDLGLDAARIEQQRSAKVLRLSDEPKVRAL